MVRPRLVSLPSVLVPLAVVLLGGGSASAQGALTCDLPSQPGATLLLPYFQVDLEEPGGRTTLFSVGNSSDFDVLAHAVLWTNQGNPVASFDVGIEPRAVRTFDVRSILAGQLPETAPPDLQADGRYASCSRPVLETPDLDPDRLRAILTGQASPDDGLCHAVAVEDGRLATGYLTVDLVNDCSGSPLVTPLDDGYLGDCASGLAANDNVLWGDFFLVDPQQDFAQGERMVAITADQTRFGNDICVDPPCGTRNASSFYYAEGNRMPLPSAYETRFLSGGGFDGGTELLVFVHGRTPPRVCDGPGEGPVLRLAARSERGADLGATEIPSLHSFKVKVGSEEVPVAEDFGCLEVSARAAGDRQLWVMPLLSAEGRYGVGLSAIPVRDFCW